MRKITQRAANALCKNALRSLAWFLKKQILIFYIWSLDYSSSSPACSGRASSRESMSSVDFWQHWHSHHVLLHFGFWRSAGRVLHYAGTRRVDFSEDRKQETWAIWGQRRAWVSLVCHLRLQKSRVPSFLWEGSLQCFQTQTEAFEAEIWASSRPLSNTVGVMRDHREREGVTGMKTANWERRKTLPWKKTLPNGVTRVWRTQNYLNVDKMIHLKKIVFCSHFLLSPHWRHFLF